MSELLRDTTPGEVEAARLKSGLATTGANDLFLRVGSSPGWWNGRHEGLRSPYRKVCRFDSCPGHQFADDARVGGAGHKASPAKRVSTRPAPVRCEPWTASPRNDAPRSGRAYSPPDLIACFGRTGFGDRPRGSGRFAFIPQPNRPTAPFLEKPRSTGSWLSTRPGKNSGR